MLREHETYHLMIMTSPSVFEVLQILPYLLYQEEKNT